jgi:hypothetical protein
MAGITVLQAQTQLDAYLAAETAVLSGQKYEIAGRMLQRADLQFIQAGITTWNARVINLSHLANGRGRSRTVVAG